MAEGLSLREICAAEDMPAASTVYLWLAKHAQFLEQYARARVAQAERWADELIDIADDGSNDWMERRNCDGEMIGWRENGEAVSRSRLRADTRKWVLSKLQPKKYGDKLDIEHGGTVQINVNR